MNPPRGRCLALGDLRPARTLITVQHSEHPGLLCVLWRLGRTPVLADPEKAPAAKAACRAAISRTTASIAFRSLLASSSHASSRACSPDAGWPGVSGRFHRDRWLLHGPIGLGKGCRVFSSVEGVQPLLNVLARLGGVSGQILWGWRRRGSTGCPDGFRL